jgi:hypothetical protein
MASSALETAIPSPRGLLLTLVLIAFTSSLAAQTGGSEIYRIACESCHGAGGRGAAQSQVGFDIPLPDFTDCSFAAREPNADWLAVAHAGGPVRGFDRMMPAFGQALSEEDLERVLDHIRTFCQNPAWPRGELNLPRPLVTEKAYPEDEAVFSTSFGRDTISTEFVYEKRFGPRNQVEIKVPFGFSEADHDWRGGIGDVAIGVKRVLYHSLERGSIFSAAAELALPTGDADDGFGKGTAIFEPFVAFGKILPAEWFVQAQAGLEFPLDTNRAEREGFLRTAIGTSFTQGRWGRTWSPMVELLAGAALGSGSEVQWDAVPQLQVTLNTRQHLMANVGVRFPLNNREDQDPEVLFYLLWDWFDGGLRDGW